MTTLTNRKPGADLPHYINTLGVAHVCDELVDPDIVIWNPDYGRWYFDTGHLPISAINFCPGCGRELADIEIVLRSR